MSYPGIYLHIPFCLSRCSYCDFATGMYESGLAERYVDALIREISEFQPPAGGNTADTVYFGGGTPSLLSPLQVEKIVAAVRRRFPIREGAEFTMEMNPGTVSLEQLGAYRQIGINRASFGAQTFDDHELARLGRRHTAADVRTTIELLREAGFTNTSFDLITGLPGQTMADWIRNLDEALTLSPEHLSLYLLEVHEGTPLADHIRRGLQPAPDDDLAARMYEVMLDKTAVAGYEHYEISNFARPGFESRHNNKYWKREPVFGFGCSAHSHDGSSRRWSNVRDVNAYVSTVESGESPITSEEQLSQDDIRSEGVFLGLRLLRGFDLREYEHEFGYDLVERFQTDIERLTGIGLISIDDHILKLTRQGALFSNEVFSVFV